METKLERFYLKKYGHVYKFRHNPDIKIKTKKEAVNTTFVVDLFHKCAT